MYLKGICDEVIMEPSQLFFRYCNVKLVMSPFFRDCIDLLRNKYKDENDTIKKINTMLPKYWMDKKLSEELTNINGALPVPVSVIRLFNKEDSAVIYMIAKKFDKSKENKILNMYNKCDNCIAKKYDAMASHNTKDLSFSFEFKDDDIVSTWMEYYKNLEVF